jgi:glutaconyl-CoA/methylmalonyl-CoA decarboxylase subunit gamma
MKLRIKVDLQTFEVEVGDINARPILVNVDGDTIEVWPEEAGQPALQQVQVPVVERVPAGQAPAAGSMLPPATMVGDKTKTVLAPIPGVIISINIKEGDQVAFGQELCVLEAMKMKNLIRASRAGKIASIKVAPGDQVRHSQVLMEFSD